MARKGNKERNEQDGNLALAAELAGLSLARKYGSVSDSAAALAKEHRAAEVMARRFWRWRTEATSKSTNCAPPWLNEKLRGMIGIIARK